MEKIKLSSEVENMLMYYEEIEKYNRLFERIKKDINSWYRGNSIDIKTNELLEHMKEKRDNIKIYLKLLTFFKNNNINISELEYIRDRLNESLATKKKK